MAQVLNQEMLELGFLILFLAVLFIMLAVVVVEAQFKEQHQVLAVLEAAGQELLEVELTVELLAQLTLVEAAAVEIMLLLEAYLEAEVPA